MEKVAIMQATYQSPQLGNTNTCIMSVTADFSSATQPCHQRHTHSTETHKEPSNEVCANMRRPQWWGQCNTINPQSRLPRRHHRLGGAHVRAPYASTVLPCTRLVTHNVI